MTEEAAVVGLAYKGCRVFFFWKHDDVGCSYCRRTHTQERKTGGDGVDVGPAARSTLGSLSLGALLGLVGPCALVAIKKRQRRRCGAWVCVVGPLSPLNGTRSHFPDTHTFLDCFNYLKKKHMWRTAVRSYISERGAPRNRPCGVAGGLAFAQRRGREGVSSQAVVGGGDDCCCCGDGAVRNMKNINISSSRHHAVVVDATKRSTHSSIV